MYVYLLIWILYVVNLIVDVHDDFKETLEYNHDNQILAKWADLL